MVHIVLFHSVCGLRSLERAAAARLEAAGHVVIIPDLYGGRSATSIAEGFAIREGIGRPGLVERAEQAVAGLPGDAVLGGFSMGAGIAASLWPGRPHCAGFLALHGTVAIPVDARRGLPLQVHLADPDPYEPADEVAAWRVEAERSGIAFEVFTYPGAGHLYTDASLPDYDAAAAEATWRRAEAFLARL